MLRLIATIALLMSALFGTVVLMLSRGPAVASALDAWQVIFIAHDTETGMIGRSMSMDGDDVQPVTLDGRTVFYVDCSPDGESLVLMAGHSAYIARDEAVRRIEAETVSAIDVSVSNSGAAIFNGAVSGREGAYLLDGGDPRDVTSRLPTNRYGGGVMYDLSPEGSRVAYHTVVVSNLYVVDMNGTVYAQLPGVAFGADWSPDGTMVVFAADWDGNFEIYVLDVSHAITAQITRRTGGYGNTFPAWTPDGRQIMYIHAGSSGLGASYGGDLSIVNMDGTGQRRLAHFRDEVVMGCVVSGGMIAYGLSGEVTALHGVLR